MTDEKRDYKSRIKTPPEPICEELGYISEKEFKELPLEEKWKLVQAASKAINNYRIGAEKNCEECEKHLINVTDLNIDYMFEDWRACAEICEETGKCPNENHISMCNLQFEIISLLASEIREQEIKLNSLTKLVLKRTDVGNEILDGVKKEAETVKRINKHSYDIYQ